MKDYYQILGIDQGCSKDDIKRAFRLYATKFHPDKQSGDKFFEERFKEIYEAYEILYDDQKRISYDLSFKSSKNATFSGSPNAEYLRKREEEIRRKEQELSRKEAEIKAKADHFENSDRVIKEYELSKKLYFQDFRVSINGLSVQVGSRVYLFENYMAVKSRIIKEDSSGRSKNGNVMLGTASICMIVGVLTTGLGFGIALIIFAVLIYFISFLRFIFLGIYNLINSEINSKYQISLAGKNKEDAIFIGDRSISLKIEKTLDIALKNYYTYLT